MLPEPPATFGLLLKIHFPSYCVAYRPVYYCSTLLFIRHVRLEQATLLKWQNRDEAAVSV